MAGAGKHPVFWAAFVGDLDAVMGYTDVQPELLHQGNHKGTTALIWAAKGGCAEVAEFLLDKGADVNAKDNEGYTALYRSCLRGHLEVVELLLQRGADATLTYGRGRNTVLRSACSHGHAHVVKLLMVHGGNDVDVLNHYGRTPLSCACRYGHAETVAVLLEAGADWTVVDKWGQTPFVTAIRHAHDDCVRVLMEWEVEYQLCKLRHMRDAAGVWEKHLQHAAINPSSSSSSSSPPASAAAASSSSSSFSTSSLSSSSSSSPVAPPAPSPSSSAPAHGTTVSTAYTPHTPSPPPPPDTPAPGHTQRPHTHVHTHACVPPFLRQRISDTHTPLPFPHVAIRQAASVREGPTACEHAGVGLGVPSCGSVCIDSHTHGSDSGPVGGEEGGASAPPSSSSRCNDDETPPPSSCRHHDDDEDHHRHHYCRAAPSSPRRRRGRRHRRRQCRHHDHHHHNGQCHQPVNHSECGANGCAAAGCGEGPEAMRRWWERWFGRGDGGNGDITVDKSSVHTRAVGIGGSEECARARGDSTRGLRVEGDGCISEEHRGGGYGGDPVDNDDGRVGVPDHADDHHDDEHTAAKSGERGSRCSGSDDIARDDDASDDFLLARQVVEYVLTDLDREVFIDMTGFTCAHHDSALRSSSNTHTTNLQGPGSAGGVGPMSPAYVVVGRDGGEASRGLMDAKSGGGVSVSHGDGC